MSVDSVLAVADWRQRTHALYRAAQETPDPVEAWTAWRAGRDAMFLDHPASPLLPEDRDGFAGLAFPDYDPAWRFEAEVEEAPPAHLDVPTGTDGVVPFDRIGLVGSSSRSRTPPPGGRAAPTAAAGTWSTRSRAPTSGSPAGRWSST
jgi:uncharacterized protein (DUF1684 family)